MRVGLVFALGASLLSACVMGISDRFPSVLAAVQNDTRDPIVVVIAAGTVRTREDPRAEVRAYVVQPGDRGWTHGLLLRDETGWLSAYSTECVLIDREELKDGEYDATIEPDGTMDVAFIEAGPSAVKPAMVQTGDSCGFAAGFREAPAGPLPTDGIAPEGDVLSLQRDALAAVGLEVAAGIELRSPSRLRWLPGFTVLETLSVRNGSERTIVIPNELTALRWDGAAWIRERCMFEQGDDLPRSLRCQGAMTHEVGPGGELGGGRGDLSLFFDWPARETEPGTYALVMPVYHPVGEPRDEPSVGACVIVTVTATP